MLASIFSLNVLQTALELGCIYALVALALFLSYSILNIADLSTDGCFTLGCAVACQVALTGHPILALFAAMAAGVCSGFVTAFLQTRLGVESIMAGIIVNTGLYTINLAVMGFSSTMSLVKTDTPQSSGKKGDHLIGDYYVAFDKHYRAEVKELQAKFMAEGMNEEDAKAKAEKESPLMQEAHAMLVKWEANDPEVRALWRKMNEWVYEGFDETYKALGVSFDKIYYESDTYLVGKQAVEEGLSKGLFFRKEDGSVWADLTKDGLDEKLLLRADGTSVYMTQDIGTAKLRFQDFPINKMIYVVGNEQNYHFQVLSILLDRLGFEWGKSLVHFSYGMVELPNGKMKSREGTVVDADDLVAGMIAQARQTIDEAKKNTDMSEEEKQEVARIVGMGALKYFLLKVDARKNMLFNPEESIDFNGNTGPFIQYTYARIRSILRKAADAGINVPDTLPTDIEISTKEEEIIQHIADFAAVVRQAGKEYQPAAVANYCYELVKEYNQFYHDFSILREEDSRKQMFRLVLSKNVAKVVRLGMGLLGIEMPERM